MKIQKPPSSHHPWTPHYPRPSPAPPARPHLPFTLCALTSLSMRVIGISKRWRGQKGTQPHPENLIGESLEAQHSKGESLLNYTVYAYIPTYASFILRSVSILSLFQRLFLITWESSWNHYDITFSPNLLLIIIFWHFTFSPISSFNSPPPSATCFYFFIDNFTYFFFSFFLTFSYKPLALGFHKGKYHIGSLWITALNIEPAFSLSHHLHK